MTEELKPLHSPPQPNPAEVIDLLDWKIKQVKDDKEHATKILQQMRKTTRGV